ncbi:hypothetical protein CFAM422_000527 [Trichoderma lentiforme]|uniref:Uncharacterized protein n=1 Tax=Trichoderma lentiforme TaxID=1567552 RepID=A0A9P5CJ78_9HYPO|nr:hypothetical protein CFAM422_000527 [Trichoderma lentiforme]
MTGGASGWQRSRKSKPHETGVDNCACTGTGTWAWVKENPAGLVLVWLRLFHCRRPVSDPPSAALQASRFLFSSPQH